MSNIEFESPASRVIKQFSGKKESEFRIPADLPDITFLRRLSIQGRLRFFQGTEATNPYITITPNIGETLFIYRVIFSNRAAATNTLTVVNDNQTRISLAIQSATSGASTVIIDILDSLVGNGISTITLDGSGNGSATILAWVENTSRIRDVTI